MYTEISDERHLLIKDIFPTKKEYFYWRDLLDNIRLVNIQQDLLELMHFNTRKFLDTYRHLVQQCKEQHCDYKFKHFCDIYTMQAMRDSERFNQEYKSLQSVLVGIVLECNKKTRPAEQVLTSEELRLVLFEKPGLINRCAKPDVLCQHIAFKRSPSVIKFIDEPSDIIVDEFVSRDVKNILLVKPEFWTLTAEVQALNKGILKLKQIPKEHKKRLVENTSWNYNSMFELIQRIEEQSDSLTPNQLETFRLNAVACSDEDTPVIKYIRNPSKAVKEKAITIRPDHIKYIRFQYPAIQELALFVAFSYMCTDLNYLGSRNITLDSVYKLLKNPLQNVTQVYKDLKDIYNNPQNITKLKYQNEYVHKGMLELATAKNLDINRVFNMFQKPTEDIKHIYEWTLKQQQEEQRRQRMREMYSNVYF